MITESYCAEKEALFSPGTTLGEKKNICDAAIATFSGEIYNAVLEKYAHRVVGQIDTANGHTPIFLLDVNDKNVIFYLSPIGSCLAGTFIIEAQWQTGFQKLIIFGSAGALDSEATDGKYVIPTQAYRDEGLSYPLGRPSAPAPSIQYRGSNLDRRLVSYMILYMFQCHSPKSSHLLPLPQSPKDCSIHQCLFCCLVYRVIVTIFLNSIYMH